ncbi:hypothetical protein K0504_09705 [Neiella marina]|uniref:Uncharacterized protein n=1 Tax=Neiella holothuriorum TaxID=2870530 RepID=A0ABS7EG52_9GAMM|nr:hypothetical protein [Neiella holothuriorum]MBW8191311.1 hypothetical protein [Neiella holothuriorum]
MNKIPQEDLIPLQLEQRLVLPQRNGRVYVASGVRGRHQDLTAALSAVCFDPENDLLVMMGNIIDDAGDDSFSVFSMLQHDWCYALMGTEEAWLLAGLCSASSGDDIMTKAWRKRGAKWFGDAVTSHGASEVGQALKQIHNLPLTLEIRRNGQNIRFVHGVPPGLNWESASFRSETSFSESCVFGDLMSLNIGMDIRGAATTLVTSELINEPVIRFNARVLPRQPKTLQLIELGHLLNRG